MFLLYFKCSYKCNHYLQRALIHICSMLSSAFVLCHHDTAAITLFCCSPILWWVILKDKAFFVLVIYKLRPVFLVCLSDFIINFIQKKARQTNNKCDEIVNGNFVSGTKYLSKDRDTNLAHILFQSPSLGDIRYHYK
jgi:hypothetical protein